MIMIFCLFIIYLGIAALFREDISFSWTGKPGENRQGLEMIMITTDVNTLVGIFALAYMIHNSLAGMMKSNRDSSNNTRDIGIAYFLVFIFYCILGLFGMFAVAALYNHDYNPKQMPGTLMELLVRSNSFLKNYEYIIGCFALFLIFTQLTTVIPILCFFTRRQFFELIYGPKKRVPNLQFHIFNVFFNISCLVVQLANLDISKIIGLTGALGGFLLIYIIPIYLHVKCLYWDNNVTAVEVGIVNGTSTALDNNEKGVENEKDLIPKVPIERCREHTNYLRNYTLAYVFYGFLVLFGLAILIAQLYDVFKKKEPESR